LGTEEGGRPYEKSLGGQEQGTSVRTKSMETSPRYGAHEKARQSLNSGVFRTMPEGIHLLSVWREVLSTAQSSKAAGTEFHARRQEHSAGFGKLSREITDELGDGLREYGGISGKNEVGEWLETRARSKNFRRGKKCWRYVLGKKSSTEQSYR